MEAAFAELASDPALVRGIYEHCDQWCTYCHVTTRCLVFRATERWKAEHHGESPHTTETAVAFTKAVAKADGVATRGLDEALARRARKKPRRELNAVERLARTYAVVSEFFLHSNGWTPPTQETVAPGSQPAPIDVVAWYHVVIAMRIGRAFDGLIAAGAGDAARAADAEGSAKVALIGIDRSLRAIQLLPRARRRQAEPLLDLLQELRLRTEKQFPGARAFIRPGLDGAA